MPLWPPVVAPDGREHTTVELRTVLRVEGQRHLTRGDDPAAHLRTQEGEDKPREAQSALDTVFDEVLVLITLQTPDGLVGTTQLHTERLRPPEEVTVLIGQRGRSAEVTSRVRTLRLETDGRGLVRLYLDTRVEQRRVGHRLEVDVRIPHGPQSSEVVIGVLQGTGRIGLALLDEGVLLEHVPAQMDDRVVGRTTLIDDVTDIVMGVQRVLPLSGIVRMHDQLHVHRLFLVVPARLVGDILLMEPEIAAILQERGDLRTLTVQRVHTESLPHPDLHLPVLQQSGNHRVADLRVEVTHEVRLVGMQHVEGIHLPPLLVEEELHLGVEITLVLQGLPQYLTRLLGHQRVVDDGRLTHIPQRAVDPRAVLARHRIHTQGDLQRIEPAGVTLLSDIALQLRGVDVLILPVGHHPHAIEQIHILGQITRRRTATHQQSGCQQGQIGPYKRLIHQHSSL